MSSNSNVNLKDPVWDTNGQGPDVQSLFKTPFWESNPQQTGLKWYNCMKDFGVFIYDNGPQLSNISDHAAGPQGAYAQMFAGNMPPGGGFNSDAMEMFRIWYNQGSRKHPNDPPPSHLPDPIQPGGGQPTKQPFVVADHPVWVFNDPNLDPTQSIQSCFVNPCWIEGGQTVAANWKAQMLNFDYDSFATPSPIPFDLTNYEHVKGWALTIYNHLASQSMPVTEDWENKGFSAEAIKAFKLWYESGCPQTPADVGHMPLPPQPLPDPPQPKPFQTRKSIVDLSPQELQAYRMAVLKLGSENTSSIWQTGGYLHAHWCLHYMQASFPWHRAHLMWLEAQLGVPIPYWNFFSSQSATPGSLDYGIPQAFLDDTFVDTNGQTQPNPLRHALAREGKSRASSGTNVIPEVSRAPQITDPTLRDKYISDWVPKYLDQILAATKLTTLTTTAQQTGFTFTFGQNDLTTWNDVSFYPDLQNDFDVALEQAHDNYHGWCGPDMANNSFAAYDPLFWSFHANFDRIFESWLRGPGKNVTFDANFPMRPFVLSGVDTSGGQANNITVSVVEDGDPKTTSYTTIGDMVKDSKSLGFTYLQPAIPDYSGAAPVTHASKRGIIRAATASPATLDARSDIVLEDPTADSPLKRQPFVVFPNTKCTNKTYYIHVGIDKEPNKQLVINEPGYIGHISRLGMGPDNGNNRCIQNGILRRLDGAAAAKEINLQPTDPLYLKVLVKQDIADQIENEEVPASEYKQWEGFTPVLLW